MEYNNIYEGDVDIPTQKKLDEFGLKNHDRINGSLVMNLNEIKDLSPLRNLKYIEGSFIIEFHPFIESLNGLENLVYVGKELSLFHCDSLENIKGLKNLKHVECLSLTANENIMSLSGLENLTECSIMFFTENNKLTDYSALQNVETDFEFNFSGFNNSYIPTIEELSNKKIKNNIKLNS